MTNLDLMSIMTTNEVGKSYFMYSSHPVTQGEMQNFDTCNFLNKVEYESFMFLVDSMQQSYVDDSFQLDSS